MKKKVVLFILMIYLSCQTNKKFVNNNEVVIYKFLYNNDYPFPQTEKSFWINGENESEFNIYKYRGLNEDTFLDFIYSQKPTLIEKDSKSNFWYMYAFIFPSNDTIYSNNRLDQWKVKRNGKEEYYSGPNINSSEINKEFCNFFSLNNFFSKTVYTEFPLKEEVEEHKIINKSPN